MALGMRVLVYSRTPRAPAPGIAPCASLDELLGASDFVSVRTASPGLTPPCSPPHNNQMRRSVREKTCGSLGEPCESGFTPSASPAGMFYVDALCHVVSRSPVPLKGLECQVSKFINSDAWPRPTTPPATQSAVVA